MIHNFSAAGACMACCCITGALALMACCCNSTEQVKSVMTDAKLIYKLSSVKAIGKSTDEFYVTVINKSDVPATSFVFKNITGGYRYGIHKDGDPDPPLVHPVKLDWFPTGEHQFGPWTTMRFVIRPASRSGWLVPKPGYIRCIDLSTAYRTRNTLHDSTWSLTAPE